MSWSLLTRQTLPDQILRYDLHERAVHWLVGLTCVYLILTGLGLHAASLFWLMRILGGGQVARLWHPIIGVVYFVSLVWMWILWHKDLKPAAPDAAWMKSVLFYMTNRDEHLPPTDRWNPGQKIFFWMMLVAGFALVLSGAVLWFPEQVPWSWKWLRFLAILIHSAAAVASIGGLLLHIYMGAAFVRGGFEQMITGYVSREWAEHHHELWYQEQAKKERQRETLAKR